MTAVTSPPRLSAFVGRCVQADPGRLFELLHAHQPVQQQSPVDLERALLGALARSRRVVDAADERFEEISKGDNTGGSAVLIDDHGGVAAPGPHVLEQFAGVLCFRRQ